MEEEYKDAIDNVLRIARETLYKSIIYVIQREELDIDEVENLIEDIRKLDDHQNIITQANTVDATYDLKTKTL